ncbi:MAG TPA: hypothetical protein VN697_01280, partial [Tepidiformaceae bacterium]|nr:hypothetical protein [Tepidiformaceae bacterium]
NVVERVYPLPAVRDAERQGREGRQGRQAYFVGMVPSPGAFQDDMQKLEGSRKNSLGALGVLDG